MSEDKITKQWVSAAFGSQGMSHNGWEIFDVLQRMKLKIVKKDASVEDKGESNIERLRAALEEYGRHTQECRDATLGKEYQEPGGCICGLSAVLSVKP